MGSKQVDNLALRLQDTTHKSGPAPKLKRSRTNGELEGDDASGTDSRPFSPSMARKSNTLRKSLSDKRSEKYGSHPSAGSPAHPDNHPHDGHEKHPHEEAKPAGDHVPDLDITTSGHGISGSDHKTEHVPRSDPHANNAHGPGRRVPHSARRSVEKKGEKIVLPQLTSSAPKSAR